MSFFKNGRIIHHRINYEYVKVCNVLKLGVKDCCQANLLKGFFIYKITDNKALVNGTVH